MAGRKKKRVWIFAAVLGISLFIGAAGQYVMSAEWARTKVTTLMKQEMEGIDGKIVRVVELNVGPGGTSPAHTHPGHIFGYVIEGEFEVGINDDPPKLYQAGEVFYEPAGAVHRVGRNPSETNSTRVVAFMFLDKGKLNTVPHLH
jgi:quercetin dioxygenase-like cupin family protein